MPTYCYGHAPINIATMLQNCNFLVLQVVFYQLNHVPYDWCTLSYQISQSLWTLKFLTVLFCMRHISHVLIVLGIFEKSSLKNFHVENPPREDIQLLHILTEFEMETSFYFYEKPSAGLYRKLEFSFISFDSQCIWNEGKLIPFANNSSKYINIPTGQLLSLHTLSSYASNVRIFIFLSISIWARDTRHLHKRSHLLHGPFYLEISHSKKRVPQK